MNYCPYCGTANRDGSRFCNECGRKMPTKTGIVCPMCSHINPTTNIYCDNCQARLVPAAAPATPSEVPETPQQQSSAPIKKAISLPTKSAADIESEHDEVDEETEVDETPGWLQNLRKAVPKASERRGSGQLIESATDESGEDLPDWMRTDAPEDQDWFQRVSSSASGVQREPSPPVQEEEYPDGLSDADDLAAADVPDWLSNMRSDAPATEPEAETLPDWLAESEADTSASTAEQPADTPDWLSGLRSVAPAEEETEDVSAAETEELPDWLADIAGDTQEETSSEAPVAKYASEDVSDELPDWMSDLAGGTETESDVATPVSQDVSEDTPDWLSGLRTATPAESYEETETVEEEDDSLDWLRDLTPAEQGVAAPVAETSSDEDVPDWLQDFSASQITQVEEESAAVDDVEIEPGEVPDWLKDLRSDAPASETAESVTSAFVGAEEDLQETQETPDWLSEAQQEAPVSSAETSAPAEPAEVPDWLRDLGPLPRGASAETPFGEVPAAEVGDIPQWLRGAQPDAEATATPFQASEEEGEASGLTAAAIPSWLEALRPAPQAEVDVEALEEAEIETEGLLAGLRSVLPASALMAQAVDRPAATRMQMSGVDVARAGLFQELLSRGSAMPLTTIKPGFGLRVRARDWVTRLVILVLFLALISIPTGEWGAFTKTLFQLNQLGSAPYAAARQAIDALPDGSHVLVAFDYDAAQAGEMDEVADALLTHLVQRNAQMDAVGLNPASPMLADRLLPREDDEIEPKIAGLSFSSIRYLPGEAAGAQQALNATSYDLLVVLAGSPETMRVWIEQAALVAPDLQVMAGLSAGAWSQVYPYVRSGQVSAEVTGAMSALAYQQALENGATDVEREKYSEALFLAQVAFAVLLALGAVVSVITRSRQAS